jgi:nucleotide-binding universal stress UspA family protein
MERAAGKAVASVEGLRAAPAVETVIGRGASWAEALDDIGWDDGDVLVVGSSDVGPVAQVFLGSRATKILRHSPVPAFVVPRGRAEALARPG